MSDIVIDETRTQFGFHRIETATRWRISIYMDGFGNVENAYLTVDEKNRAFVFKRRIKTGEFVYQMDRTNGHFTDGRSSKYKSQGSAMSALRRRATELTESEVK
jgi:hypothetical protein